jgi:hypothetical protein
LLTGVCRQYNLSRKRKDHTNPLVGVKRFPEFNCYTATSLS